VTSIFMALEIASGNLPEIASGILPGCCDLDLRGLVPLPTCRRSARGILPEISHRHPAGDRPRYRCQAVV